jgi:heme exporter protein C
MNDSTVRDRVPAMTSPKVAPRGSGYDLLLLAAVLAVLGSWARVIWFTPVEAIQGPAQKIFYVHVPSAWVAFIAFFLVALTGALYLWLRDLRLDRFAESSAEAGVIFTTVVLVTGPLWGKPVWGTWWTWDARLTSTLFLWFIYVGYLVLRGAVEDRSMRARYSAVLGVLGSLLIPFIHLSVYMFRTLHPMPIVLRPERPGMPPEMLVTLMLAFGAMLLLYAALVRARYRLAEARDAEMMEEDTDAR